jgi:hypothetical protein
LAQFDDISKIQNNQIFEFADIDRDGFVDMLFLTDRKTMNFIVSYNMLKATNSFSHIQNSQPSDANVYLNQKLVQKDIQTLKSTLQLVRRNICEDTNRPIEKL